MSHQILYPALAKKGSLSYGNKPGVIILHHPEFTGTAAALNNMMISMGFVMAGYNYYIRKSGEIDALRPTNAIGGNCYNMNAKSLGLAFEGDYSKDTVMPQAQFDSGVWLIQYLMSQNSGIKLAAPHYKYWATECPGRYFPVDKMVKAATGASVLTGTTVSGKTTEYVASNSGAEVIAIQTKLVALGYKLTIDGYFGKDTYAAIKLFQSSHKLAVDGIAGVATVTLMDSLIVAKHASTTVASPTKTVQQTLNSLMNADLAVDGLTGTGTAKAISAFQSIMGIPNDGIWGPQCQACAAQIKSRPFCRSGSTTAYAVRYIQWYFSVSTDGIYGTATGAKVKAYQTSKGLQADGQVGTDTWVAMFK